jgi:hypothetical protein
LTHLRLTLDSSFQRPTRPELAEVVNAVFADLRDLLQPKVVDADRKWLFTPLLVKLFQPSVVGIAKEGVTAAAPVRVLDAQRIGGFDAVVLEADNAQVLDHWLKQHGYPSRPELVAWSAPYIENQWKITAFKIAQGAGQRKGVQTSAVRMSFKTDRPFFPYREPEEKPDLHSSSGDHYGAPSRLLRVFFVGDARAAGMRGNAYWNARVPWSDRLDDEQRALLAKKLGVPAEHIPPGAWLTLFDDRSSPRIRADEVFFEDDTQQTVVHPPDIVRPSEPVWIPADVAILAILFPATLGLLALGGPRRTIGRTMGKLTGKRS